MIDAGIRRRPLVLAVAVIVAMAGSGLTMVAEPAVAGGATPNSGQIAFWSARDGNPEIYRMQATGADQVRLTFTNADNEFDPALSPTGREIAHYSDQSGSTIWNMGSDGSGRAELTPGAGINATPSWSPDSQRLVYSTARFAAAFEEIMTIAVDGTGDTRLTTNAAADIQPVWSPDGAKIAFSSDRAGDFDIWVMNVNGSSPTLLTTSTGADYEPAWSPDGSMIAFTSDRLGDADIFTMAADGSSQVARTSSGAADQAPAWSLDGSRLAFASDRDGDFEIFTMDVDGSNRTQLTFNTVKDSQPDWGVDPCLPGPFTDTPPWIENASEWAACRGHVNGYPDFTFRPNQSISRAEMANLLYRQAGSPDVSHLLFHPFSDVPTWVTDAVTWLFRNDFATGYPDGTFRPNQPITRAAVTRMLFRINGSQPGSAAHPFTDVPAWVADAVDWIADPSRMPAYASGFPDGTFRPNADISRGQTVRITCRIIAAPGVC